MQPEAKWIEAKYAGNCEYCGNHIYVTDKVLCLIGDNVALCVICGQREESNLRMENQL